MGILSGFKKYKRYIRTADDNYILDSEWTSSETVQMNDGNTLEKNLGNIKGITDSLTSTSSNTAASAKAIKTLKDILDGKSDSSHNHDSVYAAKSHTHTKSQITDFPTIPNVVDSLTSTSKTDSLSANQGKVLKGLVDGKSDSSHNHDSRYYTETEINNILGNYVQTNQIGTKISASLSGTTLTLSF